MLARTFAILVLLFAQVPAHAGFWYSAMIEDEDVREATVSKTFAHTLNTRAEGTELTAKLRLKKGEAVVRLIDPSGTTRFTRTFRAGDTTRVEESFPAGHGEWKVRVEFRNATGRYTIKLVDY